MNRKIFFSVLVAALGYFVDVYDLILFSVVRVESLEGLGLSGTALTDAGVMLLNTQMAGMLAGGVFWGLRGDRKGRLSILFGSILLYSLANIANAFVTDVWQYAACRFIAGVGLAGEIGAGITLAAELLPRETRGIGTALIAALGVAGGLAAALVGDAFPWQTAYIVGGCMGLALFALRLSVSESGLFTEMAREKDMPRGELRLLLCDAARVSRFVRCILLGLPLWFQAGLIVTFAPEIGRALGLDGALSAGTAVLWFYGGAVAGDVASGLLSQYLRARKKALYIFVSAAAVSTLAILALPEGAAAARYYHMCSLAGFFGGYWAMMLTITAENFGTNLRATVTTATPNFVRGGAILLTSAFGLLKAPLGAAGAAGLIGAVTFCMALLALRGLRETFGTDLAYMEKPKA